MERQGCVAKAAMIITLIVASICALLFAFTIYIMYSFGPASTDWEYILPNYYAVTHVNCSSVDFIKSDEDMGGGSIEIERYIIEFCHNDSFIGLKRFPLPFNHDEDPEREKAFFGGEIGGHDYHYEESDLEYYLVDAFADKIYGPYTAKEYEEKCNELAIGELCEWISTVKHPPTEDKERIR